MADRHHVLFVRICRLPPEAPAHRSLQLYTNVLKGDRTTLDWKRSRGFFKRIWLHQLSEDFKAPINAAYNTALDRSI